MVAVKWFGASFGIAFSRWAKSSTLVLFTFIENCVWVFAVSYITMPKAGPESCDLATVSIGRGIQM